MNYPTQSENCPQIRIDFITLFGAILGTFKVIRKTCRRELYNCKGEK